jgi:hypothetical protein
MLLLVMSFSSKEQDLHPFVEELMEELCYAAASENFWPQRLCII